MKRRWLLPATLLIALTACASPETQAFRLNEDGSLAYYQGNYGHALELFRQAQIARPDLAELNLNAGAAMAKEGDQERAVRELRRVYSTEDPKLKSKAHYDIGTLSAKDGREDEAIDELKAALRLDGTDADAKHNLEILVMRRLRREEEQRRQQQQQQQGQSQQPQQQGDQNGEQQQQPQGQPNGEQQQGQTGGSPQSGDPSQASGAPQRPPTSNPQALGEALDQAGADVTIEEALKILDALRDRERQVQSDLGKGANRGQQVEKDW
jgi:Ca-activated chloride channel homolog